MPNKTSGLNLYDPVSTYPGLWNVVENGLACQMQVNVC